jgi:hypothetical protein
MATQFWCRTVISSFIQSGVILKSFSLQSYFTFFSARFLSSFILNPPSELPIIEPIKTFFSFDEFEETGVPGRNYWYVISAENSFYTVQHIECRELGSNPHPAQTLVTGL